MNKRLLLATFLCIFVIILSVMPVYASSNFYPKELQSAIKKLNTNFNNENISKTYDIFLRNKGIKDSTIAYTLVDLALKNPDSVDFDTIDLIVQFNIDDEQKIRTIMSGNYIGGISLIPEYISELSIYAFIKYTSYFFVGLLFIYLLLKNRFMFFHTHNKNATILRIFIISAFLFISLGMGAFFPHLLIVAVGGGATLLLIAEKNTNKTILFTAILVAAVLNSISYKNGDIPEAIDTKNIIYAPVSLEYLKELNERFPENTHYKVIRAIKYPKSISTTLSHPKTRISKEEQINWSLYYLMNKKFKSFKKLLTFKDVLDDPTILLALSSYYTNTFQYKKLDDLGKRLYNNPFYYRISEKYYQLTKSTLFFPYAIASDLSIQEKLNFDTNNAMASSIILIIIFLIAFTISSKTELFKCESCGEIFCVKCDDGYSSDFVCAACRNIIHRKSNAEAAILVKKTILMENNKDRLLNISRILSAILPGSGQIYLGNPIKGILITLIFSILVFLALFRFEPFIGFENYGLHLVFGPIYIVLAVVFVIVYLFNMFGRK